MKKTNLLLAAAFSMALGSIAMNASACSTVVVGKDVSATGQIMIGHNEDNDLRIVTSQYWVPAADHKGRRTHHVRTYDRQDSSGCPYVRLLLDADPASGRLFLLRRLRQ